MPSIDHVPRVDGRALRSAFTLFEIAISLALVALSVSTVLMLFPAGIKAQQQARFRILAAAKMLELVDMFANANDANPSLDHEGLDPWDVPVAHRSRSFDLESVVPSHRSGIAPLPVAIARRLDSSEDEIARILDEGGYLYYAHPQISGGFDESKLPPAPNSEAQRLVFAVTGYAQENALHSLPWKAWPYYAAYPSPPYHVHHYGQFLPAYTPASPATARRFGASEFDTIECYLWEATDDPDVQVVFQWPASPDPDPERNYGYMPYAHPVDSGSYDLPSTTSGGLRAEPTREAAIRYIQAAVWYCVARFSDAPDYWQGGAVYDVFHDVASVDPADQVRALRFMSHAATCLTRWCDQAELMSGVLIPDPGVFPTASIAVTITEQSIVNLHATCLRLCDRFAATYPYDWGVPRPMERATMMDHPLLQWDIVPDVNPLRTGSITGDGSSARHWAPIAGTPVRNTGRSISFPGKDLDGIWGDNRHFSLTAPFAPVERCRQVVFWSVDWQAFDDFETAESAPLDASRYPKGAPIAGRDLAGMMAGYPWIDVELWSYRNPEKAYLYFSPQGSGIDPRAQPTGTDMSPLIFGLNQGGGDWGVVQDKGLIAGSTALDAPQTLFSGRLGADRNFNRRLDRGPLPPSSRMRAVQVGRFNFYDPRVPLCLR